MNSYDEMLSNVRELISLMIEAELIADTNEEDEESVEEMSSCGSVGAFGYQAPLGAVPVRKSKKSNRK